MKRTNHPEKGSRIWIEPIRNREDIQKIATILADRPRDLAVFTLGVNTSLNARDLLRLKIGQVVRLKQGDRLTVREHKSGKLHCVTIDNATHDALHRYIACIHPLDEVDLLFKSRKGGGILSMSYLNRKVKSWCKEVNLTGNFGGQTLRKTFGYQSFTNSETDLEDLMALFGHNSRRQTTEYLGIPVGRTERAYRDLSGRGATSRRYGEVPDAMESYVIQPFSGRHCSSWHPDVP